MLTPGQVIDRYELVSPIADGAAASLWAARERGPNGFEKPVCLEVIHPRLAADPTFRQVFLAEARAVAAVQHRNVARVFDVADAGALLYLVMEHVDGEPLVDLLAPQKKVPLSVALRIAADACAGLHAVHGLVDGSGRPRNVAHRDVCPRSILLDRNGDVKLIDFGLALARDRASAAAEASTARYMAPEQARREPVGPHTDVFAVGAVLFRMLTGHAPYAAATEAETVEALLAARPPLHPLSPELPRPVAAVVERAITPMVGERFGSARALGDALEELLASEPRPDLAGWVEANLSPRARELRTRLGSSSRAPDVAAGPPIASAAFGPLDLPLPPGGRHAGGAPGRSPAPADRQGPSFMDVSALMARAHDPAPSPPSPGDLDEEAASPGPPIELQSPRPVPVRPRRPAKRGYGPAVLKLAIAAIVLVFLAVIALLLLPSIVRQRAIADARDVGLELKVDGVGVGLDGVTLRGLEMTVPLAPGVTATAAEVHVSGFSRKDARVRGLDLRLAGEPAELEAALSRVLTQSRARFAGAPTAPNHLSVVGARVTWQGGQGERLEAGDIGIEVDSRGTGVEDVRGTVGRLLLKTSKTAFGPWASSFERAPTKARARLMFDPPVPDGPSALVVWTKAGGTELTEVTVKIARSSFDHLGIVPAEIGLPADGATDVQLSLAGTLSSTARSSFTIDGTLFGLRPQGLSGPVDVHLEGIATGTQGKAFELEKTSVTVGPFVAGVTGTVTPHARGLRLDAAFKTLPMACEQLARAQAKNMGPLAATLQALGQRTGALRVTGSVNASGMVKYDTAQPDEASVAWLAKETCGVSIFGM